MESAVWLPPKWKRCEVALGGDYSHSDPLCRIWRFYCQISFCVLSSLTYRAGREPAGGRALKWEPAWFCNIKILSWSPFSWRYAREEEARRGLVSLSAHLNLRTPVDRSLLLTFQACGLSEIVWKFKNEWRVRLWRLGAGGTFVVTSQKNVRLCLFLVSILQPDRLDDRIPQFRSCLPLFISNGTTSYVKRLMVANLFGFEYVTFNFISIPLNTSWVSLLPFPYVPHSHW